GRAGRAGRAVRLAAALFATRLLDRCAISTLHDETSLHAIRVRRFGDTSWDLLGYYDHTGGKRFPHPVASSYAAAIRRIVTSSNGGPASCRPMGSPASVNPHGTLRLGKPTKLKGRLRTGEPVDSKPSGAGPRVAGVAIASTSASTARSPRITRVRTC